MTTPANPDDLITWLRAQLDEDERVARAVPDHRQRRGELHWEEVSPESQPGLIGDQCGNVVTFGGPSGTPRWHAEHIARHDPARVLAEVDAKRRILDIHPHRRFATLPDEWPDHWKAEIKPAFPGAEQPYVGCEVDDFNRAYEEVEPGWWCQTVRLLALPYADREGFREEWRP